jgi:hypothetical protein
MRRLLASVLLAGALAPALGAAADQPTEAQPEETTQITGDVPNFVGRWLIVSRIEIPTGTDLGSTIASLWR